MNPNTNEEESPGTESRLQKKQERKERHKSKRNKAIDGVNRSQSSAHNADFRSPPGTPTTKASSTTGMAEDDGSILIRALGSYDLEDTYTPTSGEYLWEDSHGWLVY